MKQVSVHLVDIVYQNDYFCPIPLDFNIINVFVPEKWPPIGPLPVQPILLD